MRNDVPIGHFIDHGTDQHAVTLAEALKPEVIVINVTMPKNEDLGDEHLKYPDWRGPYLAAMLEVASIKMKAKVAWRKMRFTFAWSVAERNLRSATQP
jgi:hypothetical protein